MVDKPPSLPEGIPPEDAGQTTIQLPVDIPLEERLRDSGLVIPERSSIEDIIKFELNAGMIETWFDADRFSQGSPYQQHNLLRQRLLVAGYYNRLHYRLPHESMASLLESEITEEGLTEEELKPIGGLKGATILYQGLALLFNRKVLNMAIKNLDKLSPDSEEFATIANSIGTTSIQFHPNTELPIISGISSEVSAQLVGMEREGIIQMQDIRDFRVIIADLMAQVIDLSPHGLQSLTTSKKWKLLKNLSNYQVIYGELEPEEMRVAFLRELEGYGLSDPDTQLAFLNYLKNAHSIAYKVTKNPTKFTTEDLPNNVFTTIPVYWQTVAFMTMMKNQKNY